MYRRLKLGIVVRIAEHVLELDVFLKFNGLFSVTVSFGIFSECYDKNFTVRKVIVNIDR